MRGREEEMSEDESTALTEIQFWLSLCRCRQCETTIGQKFEACIIESVLFDRNSGLHGDREIKVAPPPLPPSPALSSANRSKASLATFLTGTDGRQSAK